MRFLSLTLLAGCTLGDRMTSSYDEPEQAVAEPVERFARGASTMDPGFGVVADPTVDVVTVPRFWASMGDRICAFEGKNGQIQEDVWVDDEPSPVEVDVIDADGEGFVLRTPTEVVEVSPEGDVQNRFGMPYPVAVGERLDDGRVALLVQTGDGCALQLPGERIGVHDGACAVDADLEEADEGLYLATGGRTFLYDGAVTELGANDQVSVDPATGSVFLGSSGASSLDVLIGNSTVEVDLGGPLVDVAARAGHAIAFTETPELIRIDAASGAILDRVAYSGAMDRERVLLGDNGLSIVLTPADTGSSYPEVQFYRVRTDAQMGL